MISGVHPSFGDSSNNLTESISNETLARLAGIVHSLEQEKLQRLQKVWLRAILLLHVMYAKILSVGYHFFFLILIAEIYIFYIFLQPTYFSTTNKLISNLARVSSFLKYISCDILKMSTVMYIHFQNIASSCLQNPQPLFMVSSVTVR